MTENKKLTIMELRVKLTTNGRILVPVQFRKALGLKPGDELVLQLDQESFRVIPLQQAVAQAQKLVKKYNPEKKSLVSELLNSRQAEAQNE